MTIYKGYIIKPQKNNPRALTIAVEGRGGKIPDILTGVFTDIPFARRAIDAYVNSRPVKAIKKEAEDANEEGNPG